MLCFSYDFKPSRTSELEEDEGFSDWSQKLEQRRQRWAEHSRTEGRGTNLPSKRTVPEEGQDGPAPLGWMLCACHWG